MGKAGIRVIFNAEAKQQVFTSGFENSVDTLDKRIPIFDGNAVKASTVKNQSETLSLFGLN
jgi:hypothetical protein